MNRLLTEAMCSTGEVSLWFPTMSDSPSIDDVLDELALLREILAQAGNPYTISRAAKAMRMRRSRLEELLRTGEIPHINRNGTRLILPEDIANYLRKERDRNVIRSQRRRGTGFDIAKVAPELRKYCGPASR